MHTAFIFNNEFDCIHSRLNVIGLKLIGFRPVNALYYNTFFFFICFSISMRRNRGLQLYIWFGFAAELSSHQLVFVFDAVLTFHHIQANPLFTSNFYSLRDSKTFIALTFLVKVFAIDKMFIFPQNSIKFNVENTFLWIENEIWGCLCLVKSTQTITRNKCCDYISLMCQFKANLCYILITLLRE